MKLILRSNKLPDPYDEDGVAMMIKNLLDGGFFIAAYVEEQDGAPYLVKVHLSHADTVAAYAAEKRPIDYFIGQDVQKLIEDFESVEGLGSLSAKFESRGDPGAFGKDRNGGPSYGAYQFASRVGGLANFLNFLKTAQPAFSAILDGAGGDAAGRRGDQAFIDAWKGIARDHEDEFFKIQHAFIKVSHYDPFVRKVKQQVGLDVDARSLALKNVAWSTAVQHGPGNSIFRSALDGHDLSDDADVIRRVYAERSNVAKHFRSSTAAVQAAVKARFGKELDDALEMLNA